MGREIRRVPKGWEHPRDEKGNYIPMFDQSWTDAIDEWIANYEKWKVEPERDCTFLEWYGDAPNSEAYRPDYDSEPTCYQVYETVSEGTPTSPVFETEDDMFDWLVAQGHSEHAARRFVEEGFVFSMLMVPGKGVYMGVDAYDYEREPRNQ